jgi:hypothetical protein
LTLRTEAKAKHIIVAILFIAMISFSIGFVDKSRGLAILPSSANGLVIGPIQFADIYFLSGQNQERRSPRVGEELIVEAKVRNIGSVAVYYFPTLCDSSLLAAFDQSYVRVESGRPRSLAASMLTRLNQGEETMVWAPESGMAYVAIRSGSTTATAMFTYNTDVNMDPSTQAEARSTVPLTIEDGPTSMPIPGLPIESLILGFALALAIFLYRKRIKTN